MSLGCLNNPIVSDVPRYSTGVQHPSIIEYASRYPVVVCWAVQTNRSVLMGVFSEGKISFCTRTVKNKWHLICKETKACICSGFFFKSMWKPFPRVTLICLQSESSRFWLALLYKRPDNYVNTNQELHNRGRTGTLTGLCCHHSRYTAEHSYRCTVHMSCLK